MSFIDPGHYLHAHLPVQAFINGQGVNFVSDKKFNKGAFFPQPLGLLGPPDQILQNSAWLFRWKIIFWVPKHIHFYVSLFLM